VSLIVFLWRTSRTMVLFAAAISVVGGACSAGLVAAINVALHSDGSRVALLVAVFAALGVGKVASTALARVLIARFSQRAVARLRLQMSRQILALPLPRLEAIGTPRLLANLVDDVQSIRIALHFAPGFAVNLAVAGACSIYLGWLSWSMLLGVMICVALGAVSYRALAGKAIAGQRLARREQDTLFGLLRDLTEGLKELKLHRPRRQAFLDDLLAPSTERLMDRNVASETLFIFAQTWAQLLFLLLVGLIVFALPAVQEISSATLTGYVLTVVYLLGPLAGLASTFPRFSVAAIALERVSAIGVSLAAGTVPSTQSARPGVAAAWQRLVLTDVTFRHPHESGDRDFVLGPVDMTLRPGELVFLVGGNGSGKSTLAKVLVGLYPADRGEIRLDGRALDDGDRAWYQQYFSMVFSDAHIFDSLPGLTRPTLDATARDYLGRLDLEKKVDLTDGKLSNTNLSQGERKRLALLTAYLEDRPIYVLDEWAADQDPEFKLFYYTRLLPDLKSRGKAVLVISHDDRYFHLADRILKLEDGGLTEIETPGAPTIMDQ
jgi:putative ATP-binding cassette transporter